MNTVCGPLTAQWGVRRVATRTTLTATAYGFSGLGGPTSTPPELSWAVSGSPVPDSGALAVTAISGRTLTLQAELAGDTLTLVSTPDDGAYEVDVIATVRESDSPASASSPPLPFTADGLRPGYDHSIRQQLDSCIRDLLNRARIRPQEIFLPPQEVRTQAQLDKLAATRLDAVVPRLLRTMPTLAADLQHVVMLRYGGLR